MRRFHSGNISGHMNYHQPLAVPLRIGTDFTQFVFAQSIAKRAMPHLFQRMLQSLNQFFRAFTVVLEKLVGHTLGRFRADIGQDFQRMYQSGKCILRFGHSIVRGRIER